MPKKKKKKAEKRDGTLLVGIDLGGTKILAAVVDKNGEIVAKSKKSTPVAEGAFVVIDHMAEAVHRALEKIDASIDDVMGVGVGAPGPLDPKTGLVHFAPNLNWTGVPLGGRLEEVLDVPVFVHNDVDAGTYGEFRLGVGKGTDNVVGIFPGTGIGGGIILDGRLITGSRGSAGELGHTIVLADGPVCGCGKRGCAEAVASRTAMTRDIRLAVQNGRETAFVELVDDLHDERITSGTWAEAAEAKDELALEVLDRTAYYLGILTANAVNILDPEMVIFGGGLIEACSHWLMPRIRQVAMQYYINKLGADKIQIVEAQLGDYAAVLGAAMLARDRLKAGG
jgi:glucokinase